ncbi:MAG: transcription elongation factor GreA [Candidatus Nealsonbacteria bacterium CG02_land_8_20_14_3_00_37_10]|uniref:Transcription elongation factor GreA n=1 Tax=Candidatus Nealsonbacteria bacterium CG02_land_8_20_14_3_00_37_10 TaxID=1974699 RepID=A0A2M7DA06_9BACT|nr:MAG: transcription elongation factor GreA [Candidatus Nealsonbacteria bacterium CG02_land_8_20_14_3_00_37_10]
MVKYLTREGLEKFKKELDYLEKVKRKEVSERIRHTASQGDLKENAGYHAAKEEQGFIEGRIKELKEILSQAKIIEKGEGNKVQIGSFVCLELLEEDKSSSHTELPQEAKVKKKTESSLPPSPCKRGLEDEGEKSFQVVGPEEADILQGKISFKSPLGSAILDKKKGDIVEINTPEGKKEYEIIEIKYSNCK